MKADRSWLASIWQKWRPGGGIKRLLPLCLLGWLIVNSSALCFFLGMPVFGYFPTFEDRLNTIFALLSGQAWLNFWTHYWQWLPFILLIFIIAALIWLRKPSIFTAGLLAVSGMITSPASFNLLQLSFISIPFAICFLLFAKLLQIVWNNWDTPAPEPKEKKSYK